MTRRTAIWGIAAISVTVVGFIASSSFRHIIYDPPEPFSPSQSPGAVVPVAEYRLSGPYRHENLTVYLVHGIETLADVSFLTLRDALEKETAVVTETGSVNQLTVENQSDGQELFIQSGDIVKGGKQDRTLPYDAVIASGMGPVPVNAFCVESGRWSTRGKESSKSFGSSPYSLSTSDLKKSAKAPGEASQAAVWASVARTQERLTAKLGPAAKSETSASSLQLTLESPAVRKATTAYLESVGPSLDGKVDAIGCVVVVNGRVVTADVYASADLFRKVWPKLLEGASLEAFLEAEPGRAITDAGEDVVRAFLAAAEGGTATGKR